MVETNFILPFLDENNQFTKNMFFLKSNCINIFRGNCVVSTIPCATIGHSISEQTIIGSLLHKLRSNIYTNLDYWISLHQNKDILSTFKDKYNIFQMKSQTAQELITYTIKKISKISLYCFLCDGKIEGFA